jgi:hypothetical protein
MESWGRNREVLANRPGIIIKNKTEKICLLTDVARPWGKKKYKTLSTEIHRMWNMLKKIELLTKVLK